MTTALVPILACHREGLDVDAELLITANEACRALTRATTDVHLAGPAHLPALAEDVSFAAGERRTALITQGMPHDERMREFMSRTQQLFDAVDAFVAAARRVLDEP
ncbi:hypothetical protein [Streptomyces sp. NPDC051016]|uniref:hypothetical protein n=1 Tax=Streptomyces sp. NPDC051016 TaxID=3365638 RepID=UPI0037BAFC1E